MELDLHPSNKITLDNLNEVVYWHKPTREAIDTMVDIAKMSEEFMRVILSSVPDCADKSTALRCVREARMWANAALMLDPQPGYEVNTKRVNEIYHEKDSK